MIIEAEQTDLDKILNIVSDDIFQNVYLYIDILVCGITNDHVKTWIISDNNKINFILYKYYNSLQVFCVEKKANANILEVIKNIKENNYEMISGRSDFVANLISNGLSDYSMFEGGIFSRENVNINDGTLQRRCELASKDEMDEIAALICSDNDIGGHYSVELLSKQLVNRMENEGCRNLVYKVNGKIVAHFATYAETSKIGVLGGLITLPEWRGKGIGRLLINELSSILYSNGKKPVLYCYSLKLMQWYASMGWKEITHCAKLERNRGL